MNSSFQVDQRSLRGYRETSRVWRRMINTVASDSEAKRPETMNWNCHLGMSVQPGNINGRVLIRSTVRGKFFVPYVEKNILNHMGQLMMPRGTRGRSAPEWAHATRLPGVRKSGSLKIARCVRYQAFLYPEP